MKKRPNYVLVRVVLLVLALAQKCFGDFWLFDNDHLIVNQYHYEGELFDTSKVSIISGGTVYFLYAYESSTVDVSGGYVWGLFPKDSSSVNISGGTVEIISAYNSSSENISGGVVNSLSVISSGSAYISGGSVGELGVLRTSSATFYGRNFNISGGLVLNGDRILGTGTLTGEWMNGAPWMTTITANDSTATIRVIPEPATLLLFGLGAVMLRRKC